MFQFPNSQYREQFSRNQRPSILRFHGCCRACAKRIRYNKMQHPIAAHPSSVNTWNPPPHIAKELIKHAVRKIPNNKVLLEKLFHGKRPLKQMPSHKYDDGGTLSWLFMN
jgi:hypothetical protein